MTTPVNLGTYGKERESTLKMGSKKCLPCSELTTSCSAVKAVVPIYFFSEFVGEELVLYCAFFLFSSSAFWFCLSIVSASCEIILLRPGFTGSLGRIVE